MSYVYSIRMTAQRVATGGTFTPVIVPAGVVWIIRDIRITCLESAPSGAPNLFARTPSADVTIVQEPTPEPDVTLAQSARVVLEAGNEIRFTGHGDSYDVLISGYQLSAP